uniref:PH domain-containing protein n=1 Tax=Oryzias melastigma TaxID=30732 RepID=A0A3B3CTM8_ORYME
MFKQWKEKYLVLTVEGSLLVCRDAESPPDQVVSLQTCCESVAEGREILDLPRLPPGGRRDCCFALILPQNKFLLLLSDSPDDCSCWQTFVPQPSLKSPCGASIAFGLEPLINIGVNASLGMLV